MTKGNDAMDAVERGFLACALVGFLVLATAIWLM